MQQISNISILFKDKYLLYYMLQQDDDYNETMEDIYLKYQKIENSKFYIIIENKQINIYIPNTLEMKNNITCQGYILDVNAGEYDPLGWIKSIQVMSKDVYYKK